MATIQELESALIKADAAGNVDDARALTRAIDGMRTQRAQPTETVSQQPRRQDPSAGLSELGVNRPAGQYGRKNPRPPVPVSERAPTEAGPEYDAFMRAESERNIRSQTDPVIKFAPSVAAAMATGGASVPAQMLATGGAQFLGSAATGSTPREAGRDALLAATPVLRFGSVAPGAGALKTGLLRAGGTGASAAVLSEAGEALQEGEYQAPKSFDEAARRIAAPALAAGISSLGSAGEMFASTGARAQGIRTARSVGNVINDAGQNVGGASLALTDVLPGYAGLEARNLAQGNQKAVAALRDMTKSVNENLVQTFSDVPNINETLRPVLPEIGKLEKLRGAANEAQMRAQAAREAADAAASQGLPEVRKLAKEAADAGFAAANAKAVYDLGVDRAFAGNKPTLFQLSPEENASRMAALTNAAVAKQKEAVGALYEQAGIDINAPVLDEAGAIKAINAASREKGNLLRGDDARKAAISQIRQAFGEAEQSSPQLFDSYGRVVAQAAPANRTMTVERYRRIRDGIANNLAENPVLAKSANKIASDTYSALRKASDDFVKLNHAPQYEAWKTANKAVADFYETSGSEFLEPFLDAAGGGKLKSATQLVTALEKGEIQGFDALTKLADTISNTGKAAGDISAIAAADEFRKGVVRTIGNGVLNKNTLNRATGAGAESAAMIDAKGLYQTLSKMESNGFPIEALGFGKKRDVLALARLSEARGVTRAELEDFANTVGTIGGDRAAARIAYQRAVRDEMLSRGVADRQRAIQAKTKAARKADIDAQQAQELARKASEDPLVRLFDETGTFGINADETINQSGFIQNLMTLPPQTAGKLMGALEKSNRLGVRDGIRKNAALDVIGSFGDYVKGETPEVALQKITNFFYSPDPILRNQRETLKAVLGADEYRNLQKLTPNIASALQTQARINSQMGLPAPGRDAVRGLVSGGGIATGNLTSGAVASASYGFFQKLMDQRRYNTLYTLYVDPKWAPKFAKFGYSVDKLTQGNPVALVVYQDAMRKDQERESTQPE